MRVSIVFFLIVLFVPGLLFAATQAGSQSGTTYTVPANGSLPEWVVSLSKGVNMYYYAGLNGVSFVATTAHTSGDRVYASGGSITKIYFYNGTTAPVVEPPASATSVADFSGWNEL